LYGTNKELHNLNEDIDTVMDIMIRRLKWLGQPVRIENNRIPKAALDAELEGKRKVGRPNLRRLDDTQAGLKMRENKG
jgi:hypothetical protein